jgi:hypothetical protein
MPLSWNAEGNAPFRATLDNSLFHLAPDSPQHEGGLVRAHCNAGILHRSTKSAGLSKWRLATAFLILRCEPAECWE